jgi:hypothetical protein
MNRVLRLSLLSRAHFAAGAGQRSRQKGCRSMTSVGRRLLLAVMAMTILAAKYFSAAAAPAERPKDRPAKATAAPPSPAVVDSVQFFLSPKRERLMIGGRFEGSNVSPTADFQVLAEITVAEPVGQWTTVRFKNETPYRWLRFVAPREFHGNDIQLVFWSGSRKVGGTRFQDAAEGRFLGVDLGDQASTRRVNFAPGPGNRKPQQKIALSSRTPGATIRYTLDGSTPGPADGTPYTDPIPLTGLATISAVAFKEGLAPSPVSDASYFVGASPVAMNSFHIGNSLTGNAVRFRLFARTAGIENRTSWFLIGGAYTVKLWNAKEGADKERFAAEYAKTAFPLEHFTLQPRAFDIDEEVEYERNFINFVREKSPNVQPWLYAEWVERDRHRPSDRGSVPSYQMQKLFSAVTWEESMSAMLLYVEEVQHRLNQQSKEGKPARILPCSLALGWARNLIDNNQFPGVPAGEASFYRTFFEDQVHVNPNGCYLVDAVWYAAFTGQSPEGKLLPVGTTLNAAQARVIQQLAWQIVENYPDCGLYKAGTTPVDPPRFSVPSGPIAKPTPIHLTSITPGVCYRYTLDGTVPTRTRGYVYCGTITARPGMTVKAVAFKSGMSDSSVTEFLCR